ncbi:MAG TPA: hypothetical protein DD827_03760 [Gammaproteobacteria bacterium]|nr:hypothetical protein [Gammaproteobacteria bacterium]
MCLLFFFIVTFYCDLGTRYSHLIGFFLFSVRDRSKMYAHKKWIHEDGRFTLVGRHRVLPLSPARAIAKQAEIKLLK